MRRTMATIQDVARHAGVSIATVSRVLNGTAIVNAATAERVRASMQALQYRPSRAARNLRANRSRIIGLLVADIRNPFATTLVQAVEDVAQHNGYSLILCNSGEDPQRERRYIEVLCAEQVAGAIIMPTRERQTGLGLLHEQGIPVVAVDRRVRDSDIDAILGDNVRGAREAVAHLIDNGYRRIGIVTGLQSVTTGRERLLGYRLALQDAGLSRDPELERCGTFTEESGLQLTRELLALRNPIDALFVANNLSTLGALEALHAAGLRAPDDLGLVAYDGMPWSEISAVSLTTVVQPIYELGSTAAMRLFQRMEHGEPLTRQEIVLAPQLIVRASSRRRAPYERSLRLQHLGDTAGSSPLGG